MEQHGENPQNKVIAIIPARYKSVRLEGKLLLPVAGKALILHTLGQVSNSELVDQVVVATDDERIEEVVEGAGFRSIMTSVHESGTDRIAEAAGDFGDAELIVNVQADEPMIDPKTIDNAIRALIADPASEMSTCCEPVTSAEQVMDANTVKVITNADGLAVYFSRSPIPFPREQVRRHGSLQAALAHEVDLLESFKKHTGLYVYRRSFLMKFAATEKSKLETTELLEQLRALEMGARIRVVNAAAGSVGVDTLTDYEQVCNAMELQ